MPAPTATAFPVGAELTIAALLELVRDVPADVEAHALLGVLLPDSGSLQEEEARYRAKRSLSRHERPLPLYTEAEARKSLHRLARMAMRRIERGDRRAVRDGPHLGDGLHRPLAAAGVDDRVTGRHRRRGHRPHLHDAIAFDEHRGVMQRRGLVAIEQHAADERDMACGGKRPGFRETDRRAVDGGEVGTLLGEQPPFSPFSVTPDLMRESANMARAYGVRLHTHLAETLEEEEFCLQTFGQRPVPYVESLGWTGDDVWHPHCVHLSLIHISEPTRPY